MDKIPIPCVILAGGKSSRMGQDKTQLAFGDTSLSQWVLKHLSPYFEHIYISTKNQNKFAFEASFLIESCPIYAPIIGIHNAFKILKEASEIMFVSVDTPFVTPQTLQKITQSHANVVYAQTNDRAHYLISKWQRLLFDALCWAIDSKDYTLHRIIVAHTHQGIKASDEECLNLNTIQDYHYALHLLANKEC